MCKERISMCFSCGFRRHVSWTMCRVYIDDLTKASLTLANIPRPSNCTSLGVPEIMKIKARACPSGNEACLRLAEQERERKDSGIAGVGEDASEVASVKDREEADSGSDDCAVTDGSVPINTAELRKIWIEALFEHYRRLDRWKPLGRNIKYADDFVEAGPRMIRPNFRNMGLPYGIHIGKATRCSEYEGLDVVRPRHKKWRFNPNTPVMEPLEIRESFDPDETWLLITGYDVPELRAQWAEKKRRNPQPERPVVTMTDAVEQVFGRQQHMREQ